MRLYALSKMIKVGAIIIRPKYQQSNLVFVHQAVSSDFSNAWTSQQKNNFIASIQGYDAANMKG
jgi:hypothetical protein